MVPEPPKSPADRGGDLPPVNPPSGRFIAQLFLVPGLIVFFVVLLVVAINFMFVGGQTADQYLVRIDSENSDIRWRGANDLAQALKRKESVRLRSDVGFALDLCDRLDKALKALAEDEAAIGAALEKDAKASPKKAFRKLEAQRNLVNFLTASLGDFNFPAGVPLLCRIVAADEGPDLPNGTLRRRRALWALANLGENIKGFKNLKPDERSLILAKLRVERESDNDVRRRAAKNALRYLGEYPDAADPELVAVDETLDAASKARDQYLREMVALTLNFWDGPLAEPILLRLANDNGFGTLVEVDSES